MVVEGKPFHIVCYLTVFYPVKWQHNGTTLFPDENTRMTLEDDSSGGSVVISNLSIARAHKYHSGEYKCSTFASLSHIIDVLGDDSITGNFDSGNYKIFEYGKKIELQCNFTSENADNVAIKWLKNDKPIDASADERYEIKPTENKFIINRAVVTDAGNYTCVVTNKKNTTDLRLVFHVVCRPYVGLPPDTSVVEGEKLILTCNVFGEPIPNVYWKIGNKTYEESEGRIQLLDNKEKGIPKGILRIDEATMEDRNTYTCVASILFNDITSEHEKSTFVRVKDKLAALWPFLGICAEVVVLCTIILIYEKKRNKTELDESDTDGSPEQKNTPDHGKDSEVRHRK
ncbi:UNVERIFIED_CONTAM: hypothetical protein PYX00_000239 [Menopon gallinae]|uniref:Ig-like domain-containing protein n=1 Tax=Menopon gallinae TaxID=328185 RepID=A0AAW2I9D2_9NEOP